jgi:hypothetical protein
METNSAKPNPLPSVPDGVLAERAQSCFSEEETDWSTAEFIEASYVPARFGGVPVLLDPTFAAELRAAKAARTQGGA